MLRGLHRRCSTRSSLLFYSVFEGVAHLLINSSSQDEGTRQVQNSVFAFKNVCVLEGESLCISSAPCLEEGGGARKTHTHLLSWWQDSGDSTLPVFLRRENGGTGEFLKTVRWSRDQNVGRDHVIQPPSTGVLLGPIKFWGTASSEWTKERPVRLQNMCWVCVTWNELGCDTQKA